MTTIWNQQFRWSKQKIGLLEDGRASMRRKKEFCYTRLLNKNGEYNLSAGNVEDQHWRFFSDIWNTLVEVKWRWCLLLFALSFCMSWLLFSVIYYCIMVIHGDFARKHDENWEPCLKNINSFASIFMYSLEAQHTIGFGYRYPTEECSEIIIVLGMQSMLGVVIQSFMVGVVFAKMTKPEKRAQCVLFSEHAVIGMRDKKLCFCVRIGDMRKYKLSNVTVQMMMIQKRVTAEGETFPFYMQEMKTYIDGMKDIPALAWPVIAYHVIDEFSPLYANRGGNLFKARFEIVVTLKAVISSTGITTQASTSFLPSEILWGHRFERLITYQKKNGLFEIDYSKFHRTFSTITPNISGVDFARQMSDTAAINSDEEDAPMMKEANIECHMDRDAELKRSICSTA